MYPYTYPNPYPYSYSPHYSHSWVQPYHPYFRNSHITPDSNQRFLDHLEKIVNAEHHAIQIYGKLLELTQNKMFRNIIENIRNDEKRHFQTFSEIYTQLTHGKQAVLTDATLPKSFINGVDDSVKDELEDSKFYQDTAQVTTNEPIRRHLMNASHDEQRHATWFMYILHSLSK